MYRHVALGAAAPALCELQSRSYYQNTFISIRERSTGLGLIAVDFEAITAHGISCHPTLPARLPQGGERRDPGLEPY